jgi:hypothetical protein
MRKIVAGIVSIAGAGGWLLTKANWIANRLSFLSLPDDVREALIAMSHIPTLFATLLLIVGVCGIMFLAHDYGLFRYIIGFGQRKIIASGIEKETPQPSEFKAAPERIPLLDIIEMSRKTGWDTNAQQSNDATILADSLNQAAVDGVIRFWGRKYKYDFGESASTTYPLIEIPAEHFMEFSFQPLNLFRDGQRNFYIFTGKLGRQPHELRGQIYQDIHASRDQLAEWMSRNIPSKKNAQNGESKA